MAIVDERWPGAPVRANPPATFDRQPPQDLAAEQSVLGGMLLSKDAIADVMESLSLNDFYKPAHSLVFDAIMDLYSRGEPADTITVAAELEKNGSLGRIGGAVYLHTLMATVPTAANAAFYAQIVAEKAILRRLVEAGTRIVQLGYGGSEGEAGGGEVDEIVDRAQAEIYDVTERRTTEDYVILEELLQPTMDEIDAIAQQGGRSAGVPTGFADLDNLTNGLHPGQMIIVAARPGIGKALALDTPLVTPTGWTTMGRVGVGDELIGADGYPTTVVAATEVLLGRRCFEVEFSDGEVIVADAEHQWLTWDAAARARHDRQGGPAQGWSPDRRWSGGADGAAPVCRTTAELASSLYCRGRTEPRHPHVRAAQHARAGAADRPVGAGIPARRRRSGRQRARGVRGAGPGMGDEGVRPARLPGQCRRRRRPVPGARGEQAVARAGRAPPSARARDLPARFGRAARGPGPGIDGQRWGCGRTWQVPVAHHRCRTRPGVARAAVGAGLRLAPVPEVSEP